MKVYGSLHIEMYVDMDTDRMQCITSAVKDVADRHDTVFESYEKLKSLGAPEDLLKLFKDSNFVAVTLMNADTRISLRLYIDKESRRISRIELVTSIAKQYRVADSATESPTQCSCRYRGYAESVRHGKRGSRCNKELLVAEPFSEPSLIVSGS